MCRPIPRKSRRSSASQKGVQLYMHTSAPACTLPPAHALARRTVVSGKHARLPYPGVEPPVPRQAVLARALWCIQAPTCHVFRLGSCVCTAVDLQAFEVVGRRSPPPRCEPCCRNLMLRNWCGNPACTAGRHLSNEDVWCIDCPCCSREDDHAILEPNCGKK